MSVVTISTPFNIDLEFNASPLVKRGLAYAIDLLILFLYVLIYNYLLGRFVRELPETLGLVLEFLIYYLPLSFYFFILEIALNGRSPGKIIMGLRVVNINGGKASLIQYLLRALFRSFPFAWIVAWVIVAIFSSTFNAKDGTEAIGTIIENILRYLIVLGMFLYYAVSKTGQRIGDKIANTLVIQDKTKTDIHKTIYLDIHDTAYKPLYPEVMRLTDRDINGIRNLLDVRRLTPDSEAYMARISERITTVLGITTEQAPYDFLAQLLRDYNFLTSR